MDIVMQTGSAEQSADVDHHHHGADGEQLALAGASSEKRKRQPTAKQRRKQTSLANLALARLALDKKRAHAAIARQAAGAVPGGTGAAAQTMGRGTARGDRASKQDQNGANVLQGETMQQLLQRAYCAEQLHPEALDSQHSHDVGGEAVPPQAKHQADPKPQRRTRQQATRLARLANLAKAHAKRRSMKNCSRGTAGDGDGQAGDTTGQVPAVDQQQAEEPVGYGQQ